VRTRRAFLRALGLGALGLLLHKPGAGAPFLIGPRRAGSGGV